MRAVFGFTPWESKRLIGRAVARMPEVQTAFAEAEIVIAHGSTNVYVAEELIGRLPERDRYVSGQVINAALCQTEPAEKPRILRLVKGEIVPPVPHMMELMAEWDRRSVFIKGANAVDADFNAGIFNAHPGAGTIGFALGYVCGMGFPLIVPVGLEKLVPSIKAASRELGHARVDYFHGTKIGFTPLVNAIVVTEIQAFDILWGLRAVHVGGGGVSGSEGSVVLAIEGEESAVRGAIAEIEADIKGEPPLKLLKRRCATCYAPPPAFTSKIGDAPPTPEEEKAIARAHKQCLFSGTEEDDLPAWFSRREPVA